MPNVFRFLLDKSIKFHAQHKELSCLMNTPAINRLGQLSELKSSSSRLAADSPGNFPSFSSVSNIDHSNQVSPSPSGLELDRPNLLRPPSAQEIGFRNQTPCKSVIDHPTKSLHLLPRGNHFLDLVTPVNPPTASGVSGKTHLQNKQGFQDLAQNLEVLISIVKDYEDRHLGHLLALRIRDLSEHRGVVEVDDEARFIVRTFGKISLLSDGLEVGHYLHRAYSEKFGYLPQRRWIPCSP
ncbi:hypothetical protein JB92DRAFT_2896859 [Gautieria morchelliformis]|nr:hypothetical protein JB92DRAFT_2896859 [Gautieria morchelliformis]